MDSPAKKDTISSGVCRGPHKAQRILWGKGAAAGKTTPFFVQKKRQVQRLAATWLRGADLNHRPSGYEPDELTRLLHPAMGCLKGQRDILLF